MRRRLNARWVLLLSAMSLVACATLVTQLTGRRDQIRAPHERHKKADVDCATCHETLWEATDLTTVDLPKEKVCLGCHKEEKLEKKNCGFCHTDPANPQKHAKHERGLNMDHTKHLERVKDEDCTVCHKQLPDPLWTEGLAPPMDACFTCHEHEEQYARGECEPCHKDLARFPLKPLANYSHRAEFVKNHRQEARSGAAMCANCHEDSFCAECHAKTVDHKVEYVHAESVERSFIHRNDFLSRHPIEAKADQSMCMRCHGTNFCQACHVQHGLLPGAEGALNPHPQGFGDGKAHGAAARKDIVGCAACHDQGAASNCVSCHKVGGVGGNPHPPSWLLRHPHDEIGANPMCRACHP